MSQNRTTTPLFTAADDSDFRGAWYHDDDPNDPFVDDPASLDRDWEPCPACACPAGCTSGCRCTCHNTRRRYH